MRYFLPLVLISGLSFSPWAGAAKPTRAPEPPALAFAKKVSSSESWEELVGQFEGSLPESLRRELLAAAKGTPFPEVRAQKNGHLLLRTKDAQLDVELRNDGAVFFNGKEWVVRPLATTQQEVLRLQKFLEELPDEKPATKARRKRAAWLDALVSPAWALPASPGLALAAQTTALGWRGEACGGDSTSAALLASCSQMGARVQLAAAGDAVGDYLPVRLVCAHSIQEGATEVFYRNASGSNLRYRVIYRAGRAVAVSNAGADDGSSFQTIRYIDFTQERNPDIRSYGQRILDRVDTIQREVCEADSNTKQRYMAQLESNRSSLRGARAMPASFSPDTDSNDEPAEEEAI